MNPQKIFVFLSPARLLLFIICFSTLIFNSSCAFKRVSHSKNITFLPANSIPTIAAQQLNVFAPKKRKGLKNVLIFVHGGSWNSGKKSTYNFLGNRFARKNIVTVIVDYPLSPGATYKEMAETVAASVKWVKENIFKYAGNPQKIFLSGHSAGGHLAALVSVDEKYLGANSPLKGTILLDAAGLDMYSYLKEENFPEGNVYLNAFTNDQVKWKDASPLYHIHKGMPPMIIYCGGKTYPSIRVGNDRFVAALQPIAPATNYTIVKGKRHIGMITQFLFTGNKMYKEIIQFMNDQVIKD